MESNDNSNSPNNVQNLVDKLTKLIAKQHQFFEEVNELKQSLAKLQQESKAQEEQLVQSEKETSSSPPISSSHQTQTVEMEKDKTESNVPPKSSVVHDSQAPRQQSVIPQKKLYRSKKNKIISGVCSGLAEYSGLSVILVRILTLLAFFVTGVVPVLVIYIILTAVIPLDFGNVKSSVEEHLPVKPTVSSTNEPLVSTPIDQHRDLQPQKINETIGTTTDTKTNSASERENLSSKTSLENYIGESLISKIGVIIILLGVGIGTKYVIENNLISDLTRIILGYVLGLVLFGIGLQLKKKYVNYSAVLVSGGMATFYIVTYMACRFYGFITEEVAFGLMFVLTIITTLQSLRYNKQVIAHIGLVGAYAVPFLLNENYGDVRILFTYIAIINAGIVVLSLLKEWTVLFVSAFALTWLMFTTWINWEFDVTTQLRLSFFYLTLFFLLFYGVFLGYKLLKNKELTIVEILLLVVNALIFYVQGYFILEVYNATTQQLAVFTLGNGLFHLCISAVVYVFVKNEKKFFYLTSGLAILFLTITIPVQFDGNWVSILWLGEALLLFIIGRTQGSLRYERISYIFICLALLSLFDDWLNTYNIQMLNKEALALSPFYHASFFGGLVFIAGFLLLYFVNKKQRYIALYSPKHPSIEYLNIALPSVLLGLVYMTGYLEISFYFNQKYAMLMNHVEDFVNDNNFISSELLSYKALWLINYSLIFMVSLTVANQKRFKSMVFTKFIVGFSLFVLFVFLVQGLLQLSELRSFYLSKMVIDPASATNPIFIRYFSIGWVLITLFTLYNHIRSKWILFDLTKLFNYVIHICVLWILSSEVINLLDLAGSSASYKLGLSILWGLYSVFIIILGIWKEKQTPRIIGFALMGFTLLKLFFYDIAHLTTLSKTVVMLSLGGLLLLISFLYNKYKDQINE